ncbi:MAG TPA: zf-HC2 domain-containing protein [Mycobacteriales bacterium]|nr:zf-HC2 domain-containing protein [Mycobacteriales bacterium]
MDQTTCGRIRELLSAYLDGEADLAETAQVQQHLDRCAGCRVWRARAEALTRAVRLTPARSGPDLSDRIVAEYRPRAIDLLRGPIGARTRAACRIALAAVCLVQVVISVLTLTGQDAMGSDHAMPGMSHLDHESAAWNIAVVAGLAWVALRPRKGVGALPLLGAFVLSLTGLCVHDLITGQVGIDRVALHVPVLLGLILSLIVVALHSGPVLPPGFTRRGTTGTSVLAATPVDPPAENRSHPPVARRAAS